MASQLKPWIDPKYIIKQVTLASNPHKESIKMVLDSDSELDWMDVILTNTNPEMVEVLKRLWYAKPHYKRNIFANNTSFDIIQLCLDYYHSMSQHPLPPYDSRSFQEWRDFCRNLSSNKGAPLLLLKYLSTPRSVPLPSGSFTDIEWLNIKRVVGNCRSLGGDPILNEFVANKVVDSTLDINDVTGISDDIIVDLILSRPPHEIDFWGGFICLNTNPRVNNILLQNIDKLNIYKCLQNESPFMTEIIDKLLNLGIEISWEYLPNCQKYLDHQIQRYNKIGWEKCSNIKLLEQNLDKITDFGGLPWNWIAPNPDIFKEIESDSQNGTLWGDYVYNRFSVKMNKWG